MRLKKIVLFITAICLTAVSAGCWDAKDINDKALITLVVTDKQQGEIVFYVEVPNLEAGQSQEAGSTQQFSIVRGAGVTFADARRQLNAAMEKPIFLGATRAVVLTDALAKDDLEEYMFRMQNMLDYRKTVNIVTTRDTPEDFLSVMPENNISIGYAVDETVETLKNEGKLVEYTLSDVLEFLYAGYSFVLINIDKRDDELIYNGYTIIHKGRYLGFIPLNESNGLVWLLGTNIKRLYVVPLNGYTVTVEVKTVSREITPMYSNGSISIDISFTFDSKIQYISKNIKLDKALEEQIKSGLQEIILSDITAAIQQSKSYGCDYLGFEEQFRVAYPDIIKQFDWETEYKNVNFRISVESSLEMGGMMDYEAQGSNAP